MCELLNWFRDVPKILHDAYKQVYNQRVETYYSPRIDKTTCILILSINLYTMIQFRMFYQFVFLRK